MSTIYSIPEVLKLADIGIFTLAKVSGIIPAGVIDPIRVRVSVPDYWSVITERFNFGMTTVAIPEVFYYEMYYDRGYYCNGFISQANIENHCTHILAAHWIEPWFYNVSDPPMDIIYDFACWYFIYPNAKKQEVLDLLYTLSQDEAEIMDLLRTIHSNISIIATKAKEGMAPSPAIGRVR